MSRVRFCEYMQSREVTYEVVSGSSPPQQDRDAQLFSSAGGWIVILWPDYFNVHDFAVARSLASTEGWLICTVHVYDGDYWEHLAVQGTGELHSYCSRPSYWQNEAAEAELERVSRFNPSPDRLAAAIGIPASTLTPYMVDVDTLASDSTKAHPDDQFALGDFWVFTDFWNRLGIQYPDPPNNPASIVRLYKWFAKRLPSA